MTVSRDLWRVAEGLGLSWALGLALFTTTTFALYVVGVAPGVAIFPALALALLGVVLGTWLLRLARRDEYPGRDDEYPGRNDTSAIVTVGGLGLAAVQVVVAGWMALRSPLAAFDAWSVWAFKARMFVLGGPPLGYFRDPVTLHTHPDYPLNLPLAEAALLRLPGRLGLSLAALLGPLCLAALALLFYAGLARLYGPPTAALATGALLCVPALALQAAGGDADVPLAMYAGGASVYLLLWWRRRHLVDAVLVGLLAGGAVWTKKEGLMVAALLLLALTGGEALRRTGDDTLGRAGGEALRRTVRWRERLAQAQGRLFAATPWQSTRVRSVPVVVWAALAALALPLPWLIFTRLAHPLGRDFLPLTPSVFLAHVDRLPHIALLFGLQMLDFANWSLLWVVLAGMLVPAARRLSPGGRGLLVLLLAQIGAYMVVFVFSDWQPYTAHVQTSVDRLLVQTAPLAVLTLVEVVHGVSAARGAAVTGRAAVGDAAA